MSTTNFHEVVNKLVKGAIFKDFFVLKFSWKAMNLYRNLVSNLWICTENEVVMSKTKDTKQVLAYYIKTIRMMRGFTQQEVADRVKKSTNAVSNWELGNTSPPIDDLIELCKMFDVTPNEICGWDDCPDLIDYIMQAENAEKILNDLKEQKKQIEDQIKTFSKIINRKQ